MGRRIFPLLIVLVIIGAAIGTWVYFSNTSSDARSERAGGSAEEVMEEAMDEDLAAEPQVQSNPNPDLSVDANGLSKAVAVIRTRKGDIKFRFYPKDAPNTVNRIIELINEGFYNGLTFHRVVPGFVIQGGDPNGNGTGGSGKKLKAEFNQRKHIEGTVAMARAADPDSADSQFYVSLGTHPHLDGSYTVFGQVVEGMDVAHQIQKGDKMLQLYIE